MNNKTKKNKTKKNKTHNNKTKKNKKCVFSEKDYNSGDGFLTKVWGPMTWFLLHQISFNYPVNPTHENKVNYRNFILSLKYVLPCGKCRQNLVKNFKQLPLTMKDMESRETFSKYIYNLHELINKMLCKKSGLTYEDVRERYEHFRARCSAVTPSQTPLEKGCTEPLYGEKSKCVIKIVPETEKCDSLQIDEKCIKRTIAVPM
jgi:hypothetical protein